MRSLLVYGLALVAVLAGLWFGFAGGRSGNAEVVKADGAAPPPVIVTRVERAPFEDQLEALGTVRANESVEITPNRADHVTAIHFTDNQQVKKRDLLVEMHSEEQKAILDEAVAMRDERRTNYERASELFKNDTTSTRELQNAKALLAAAEARVKSLGAALADRQLRAPFDGTLGLRRVSVGAYVDPSTVITTLDDLSVVKTEFTMPETWLAAVLPGMTIEACNDAWPEHVFAGRIVGLDTRLDPRTRSATVLATLPNPEGMLRPGMLLRIVIERGAAPVLQVPESALIPVGEEQFVMRVDDDDVAHRVPVTVGRRAAGTVEVLDGVSAGERVVIEGIVRVRDGAPVQVVGQRGPST